MKETTIADWENLMTNSSQEIKENNINSLMNSIPKAMNYPTVTETQKTKSVYISDDIEVNSEDEEQVKLIKDTYKKSLFYYQRVEKNINNIKDKDFFDTVSEIQLIMRNILLKFNEKPHRVIQHNSFIDYYQERLAKFIEQYVELATATANPNEETISKIKDIVLDLKEVFKSEFNKISETDMTDLTVEIKTMEQNLSEYVNNIDNTVPEAILKTNISTEHVDSKVYKIQKQAEKTKRELKENTMNLAIGVGIGATMLIAVICLIILLYVFL